MSRSSSGSSYHHGDLRRALVAAGVGLLTDRAASGLSLREVARAAGVSHAAPYHYFSDRAALLKAVGDACMHDFVAAQEKAVADATEPGERLDALGRAYMSYAVESPHAFALVFDAELCPPGDPSPERAPLIARNEELLIACVIDAQQTGRWVDADPTTLSVGVWGSVHGLATLVHDGHIDLETATAALAALG